MGDIGYACSSSLSSDNKPFYGDANREIPCTVQTDSTATMIVVLAFQFPAFMYVLTALIATRAPITSSIHSEIRQQITLQREGGLAFDPILMVPIGKGRKQEDAVVPLPLASQVRTAAHRWIARARRKCAANSEVFSSSRNVIS